MAKGCQSPDCSNEPYRLNAGVRPQPCRNSPLSGVLLKMKHLFMPQRKLKFLNKMSWWKKYIRCWINLTINLSSQMDNQ